MIRFIRRISFQKGVITSIFSHYPVLLTFQLQMQPETSDKASVMGSVISLQSAQTDNRDDDSVDVKALQDRLKQSESRLTDYRNQCQQLRQELKVANKVRYL